MFKNYKITLILTISLIFVFSSIGLGVKYEGPLPEDYNQAPMLDEQVEKGDLPPVEERLPDNPYVVDPNEEIGQYGGTIRTTTLSPEGYGDDTILSSWPAPAKSTADASEVVPHLFEGWDISDDYTVFTFHLREGVKWSDGHPFTTDDIMFWYEDVLLNEDLTAVVGLPWKVDDEMVEVTQIDDYTIEFEFPVTRPFFINRAVKFGAWDFFMPKHYLKQFHPEYTSMEEVKEKADEAGFDEWYEYFWDRQNNIWGMPYNPDLPGLTPYIIESKSSDRRVWKRNPYFWKVDPEGNQLPYIDKIDTEIATDLEVVQGMILSGDIDFAGMQTDIRNYPMYRNYEEDANSRTILWETGMGSDVIYMFNLTHEEPALREVFQNVDFRKAMSLAIDRNEISESIYFGRAEPRQFTVVDSSKYFEPEFAETYIEYDPEKAKELLDEVGIVDEDGDGWRERPDGEKLTFTIEYVSLETPKQPNVELVSQQWQEIGIDVNTRNISGELSGQRAPSNMMDATLWHGDKATDMLFPIQAQFFVPEPPGWERTIWPEWGRWFQTDGEEGDEPPAQIKELRGWYDQILQEPDPDKRLELGKKILKSQSENLWSIGTVGKSPFPFVIDKDLKNFPEDGYACWDTIWSMSRDPEQLFFDRD